MLKIWEEEEEEVEIGKGKLMNEFRLPGRQDTKETNLLRGEVIIDDMLNRLMNEEGIIESLNFTKTFCADGIQANFSFEDMPHFQRDAPDMKMIKRKLSSERRFHAFIKVKYSIIKFRCPVTLLRFPYVGTGYLRIKMIRILLAFNVSGDRVHLESLKGDELHGKSFILNPCNIFFRNKVRQKIEIIFDENSEFVKDAIVNFLQELFRKYLSYYQLPEM